MTPVQLPTSTASPAFAWEKWLSAILRDGILLDTRGLADMSTTDFLTACTTHGVAPLLYRQLHQHQAWSVWPTALQTALAHQVHLHAAIDALREQELRAVLDGLAQHGVQPLLMKGTPLAYTHYPAPDLRPRSDTDMLIAKQDCETAHLAMLDLGYTPSNAVSGELIMHQRLYTKTDVHGVNHVYDLHWKISNPVCFADLLTFDELASASVPIPALGACARTLQPVHALLLACIHRVAHHHNSRCLIWLYDIHLLVTRLTPDMQTAFLQLAQNKHVCAVCHDGLQLAQDAFHTPMPAALLEVLHAAASGGSTEATAHFLHPDQRQWRVLISDWRALPRWRDQLRFLKEHLMPPANYVQRRYGTRHRALLPLLYLHRALRGLLRLWWKP
ncbi:nucleotidyltransferase family protein [Candidatus Entotheonella palauensis]|uniref:nucleotidyltransferase family protein n=1 Tax=Candidatus Entotheonella palauensis TaxID=93172 RepID=UPI000B7FCA8A